MYPRVKVREQEDPSAIQEETTPYFLREGHSSPRIMAAELGSECKNDPQSHAKISKSYPKNVLTPSMSTSKGKKNEGVDEGNRTIIRESSIPRPRAVLSSPDNDGMIGSQNQLIRKRDRLLKSQNQNLHAHDTERITEKQNRPIRESGTTLRTRLSKQDMHDRIKAAQRNVTVSSPLRMKMVAMETGRNTHPKVKLTSEQSKARQRAAINGG